MTERERQILALLRDDPTLSAAAIARRLKTSAAAVTVHLSNLRQQGEIIGRGYVLKPAGQVVVIGGANMNASSARAIFFATELLLSDLSRAISAPSTGE